jgi:hypothetical protein
LRLSIRRVGFSLFSQFFSNFKIARNIFEQGQEGLLIPACALGWQIAILYSGVMEGKPVPLVLRIAVGPADRGACIRELSQYPQEIEYLFVPCSFLAPDGPPQFLIGEEGFGVRVVPVRISTSHSARTVEDHLGEKKLIHVTAFKYLVEETRCILSSIAERGGDGEAAPAANAPALFGAAAKRLACDRRRHTTDPNPVGSLLECIVDGCKERLLAHEAIDSRAYADNCLSQRLVGEMLDTRRFAVSKLRYWLEDPTESIDCVMSYSPRMCHRLLTKFLTQSASKANSAEERRAAALAVCKARGLVQKRIDEDQDGEDPLVAAAADGAAAADIRFLVSAGAAVNGAGGFSLALLESARYGHLESVSELLNADAAVNVSDPVR